MAVINDLIQAVGLSAGLTDRQAETAVGAALRFLASRLPSPLFGELQARLRLPAEPSPDAGSAGAGLPDGEAASPDEPPK